ncbi:MAG: sodium-dependent transporter [Candidatus Caenarcaniphilales bacterium]|nr:sodium-dependent transporter [Candidatus Caenarcaniphilales bacterium]
MVHINPKSSSREQWGDKLGFIMATAGAAVGLGNIWRFPYVCGENGGGAFILAYIICIALISGPILVAEVLIGRASGQGSGSAFISLTPKGESKIWRFVGVVGVLISFLLVSYYSIVAGWTLEYLWQALQGHLSLFSGDNSQKFFDNFMASDSRQILWHIFLTCMTAVILLRGINKGIEKLSKILMPVLLILLFSLAVFGISVEWTSHENPTSLLDLKSIQFLFVPDWSKFTMDSVFQALGQAAFSLSIAVGTLIAYGSYLDRKENIVNLGSMVIAMDTMVALLAGVLIFPIVFASGLSPSQGTGLIFVTLPNLFSGMPNGDLLVILFYLLIFFAALTSMISLLEPGITHLIDEMNSTRPKACMYVAIASSALGVIWILVGSLQQEFLFLNIDKIVSNFLIPLEAFGISIFASWVLDKVISKEQLSNAGELFFNIWFFMVKWLCPIAILIILVKGLISQDMGG